MDVRLPDGTVIQNVPDTLTKAELTAKLDANGFDTSKLGEPAQEPMSWGGLGENITRQAGELAAGAWELPGAIPKIPGAIWSSLEEAYGLHPGSKQRAAERVSGISKQVGQVASEIKERPAEIPGKIARWGYEHPLDVGMLAAGPITKGFTAAGSGLRGLQAAEVAAKGVGPASTALGVAAKTAETGANITPWMNVMRPAELGLKKTSDLIGAGAKWARGVVNPETQEYLRVLTPKGLESVYDRIKTKSAAITPEVGSVAETPAGKAAAVSPVGASPSWEAQGTLPPPQITFGAPLSATVHPTVPATVTPRSVGRVTPIVEGGVAKGEGVVGDAAGVVDDAVEDVFAPFIGAGEAAIGAENRAAGETFAAIQKKASIYKPESNQVYRNKELARKDVRTDILDDIAGSQDELSSMEEKVRGAIGSDPYDRARNVARPVDLSETVSVIDDIIRNNPDNRKLVATLGGIRRNMFAMDAESGPILKSGAKNVASIIDDLKGVIGDKKNRFIKSSLVDVKESLLKSHPEYAAADAAYREAWAPIHQRQIAAYLGDILKKKGEEAFAKAYDDMAGTIKKATGLSSFKNYEVIFEDNSAALGRLNSVRNDVKSTMAYDAGAADPHAQAAIRDLFNAENVSTPGLLDQAMSMARWLIERSQGRLTKKAALRMAMNMLTPSTALPNIQRALRSERVGNWIGDKVYRGIDIGTSVPMGLTYRGLDAYGDKYGLTGGSMIDQMAEQYNIPSTYTPNTSGRPVYGDDEIIPTPLYNYGDIEDMADTYGILPED
jgi:hypothetical protein